MSVRSTRPISLILKAIEKHQGEHLTTRRLCELTGIPSTSTAHRHIKLLEAAGKIRRVWTYEVIKEKPGERVGGRSDE